MLHLATSKLDFYSLKFSVKYFALQYKMINNIILKFKKRKYFQKRQCFSRYEFLLSKESTGMVKYISFL